MSTQKDTIEFILEKLGNDKRFSTRAMFGEYALYADGKVVALICDDQLYVKILHESKELEKICEKDSPYPGAKPHYLVEEVQLSKIENLPEILFNISKSLPEKRKKSYNKNMETKGLKDGAKCEVTAGTHKGKSGIVTDIKTSKTGYVTITVIPANGVRFKTLAKNVSVIG